MRNYIFVLLFVINFGCNKKEIKEEITFSGIDSCSTEDINLAKSDIAKGKRIYFLGVRQFESIENVLSVQKYLKTTKNIDVDFWTASCIPSIGKDKCYELYMNSDFEQKMGKAIIDTIKVALTRKHLKYFELH
ncbi:hypothetical protein [Flavobacterium pallidum]|uniref:Uncharacterized protein n=1 Tax=Flavobacterium pallidum TaxID=2172098 RepID=A0A2S1SKL1_9FLAO|nr:hypothetical protein [Flavobacterium pallidum]AWI26877.1 hypothetical protein HYN49_13730 [Flavobacterium pallidum]